MIDWKGVFGLWYEVAFAELEHAVSNCPEELWTASMWDVTTDPTHPPLPVAPDGSDHPLGIAALSAFWKVAFHALAATEWNMAGRPRDFTLSAPFSDVGPAFSDGGMENGTAREMLPMTPPSRETLLAYLDHDRKLVRRRLAATREVGDGESEIGPWRGTTTTLLAHYHGTCCHLPAHETELQMFLNQHR